MDILILCAPEPNYIQFLPKTIASLKKQLIVDNQNYLIVTPEYIPLEENTIQMSEWDLIEKIPGLTSKHIKILESQPWILQQIIKLVFWELYKTPGYLVVDVDLILLGMFTPTFNTNSQNFILSPKRLKNHRDSYSPMLRSLFGFGCNPFVSFITEIVFFDTNILKEIKVELETKFNQYWICTILDWIYNNSNNDFPLSEYELYGNWIGNRRPGHINEVYDRKWKTSPKLVQFLSPTTSLEELEQWFIKNHPEIKEDPKYPWIGYVDLKYNMPV